MHHVGILCENLERSLDFYQNVLGMAACQTNIFWYIVFSVYNEASIWITKLNGI